ncbi:unnamed protein product [Pylaiella littoralis]
MVYPPFFLTHVLGRARRWLVTGLGGFSRTPSAELARGSSSDEPRDHRRWSILTPSAELARGPASALADSHPLGRARPWPDIGLGGFSRTPSAERARGPASALADSHAHPRPSAPVAQHRRWRILTPSAELAGGSSSEPPDHRPWRILTHPLGRARPWPNIGLGGFSCTPSAELARGPTSALADSHTPPRPSSPVAQHRPWRILTHTLGRARRRLVIRTPDRARGPTSAVADSHAHPRPSSPAARHPNP